MKKCLTALLALSLAFTLAACGKDKPAAADPETTTGEIPEITTTESTTIEGTTVESTPVEGTTIEGTTIEGATGEALAVPTDTAGVIAYYNAALARTNMRRAAYKRTMTKITAWAALGILNEQNLQDDPGVQNLGNVDETKNAPSDLVPLQAGWVREAAAGAKDGKVTLTIKLKNRDLNPDDTAFNPKPGTNGYVSTVGKEDAEDLVIGSATILAGGILSKVAVTRTAFGLADGIYTAVVDAESGKLERVSFTSVQIAEGDAKCTVSIVPISVTANTTLRWDSTGTYLPA